jgi:hypothetical protein
MSMLQRWMTSTATASRPLPSVAQAPNGGAAPGLPVAPAVSGTVPGGYAGDAFSLSLPLAATSAPAAAPEADEDGETFAPISAEEYDAKLAKELSSVGAGSASQPVVRQGSRGAAVTTLQQKLRAAGCDPRPIDGIFGPRTKAAVVAYQKKKGLGVDGIVGPRPGARWATRSPAAPRPAAW